MEHCGCSLVQDTFNNGRLKERHPTQSLFPSDTVHIDLSFSFSVHTTFHISTRLVVTTLSLRDSSSSGRCAPLLEKGSVWYHPRTPVRVLFDGGRRARPSPLPHPSRFVNFRFACRFFLALVSELQRSCSTDRFMAFVWIEPAPSAILGSLWMPLSSTFLSLAVDHGAYTSKTQVFRPCSLLRRRLHVSEAFVPRFEGRWPSPFPKVNSSKNRASIVWNGSENERPRLGFVSGWILSRTEYEGTVPLHILLLLAERKPNRVEQSRFRVRIAQRISPPSHPPPLGCWRTTHPKVPRQTKGRPIFTVFGCFRGGRRCPGEVRKHIATEANSKTRNAHVRRHRHALRGARERSIVSPDPARWIRKVGGCAKRRGKHHLSGCVRGNRRSSVWWKCGVFGKEPGLRHMRER